MGLAFTPAAFAGITNVELVAFVFVLAVPGRCEVRALVRVPFATAAPILARTRLAPG